MLRVCDGVVARRLVAGSAAAGAARGGGATDASSTAEVSALVSRHAPPAHGELLSHAGPAAIKTLAAQEFNFTQPGIMLLLAAGSLS